MLTHRDWIYVDFDVAQNATWNEVVTLGREGDTWNLDAASFELQVRPAPGHPVVIFDSVPGHFVVVDSDSRQVLFQFGTTPFAAAPAGTYYYDLIVTQAGLQRRRLAGNVRVHGAIST